jgi:hypothetical protein
MVNQVRQGRLRRGHTMSTPLVPRTFYDDFPFGRAWVEMLPPYNEHLVSDVGGFYLGFALLFAWAAVSLHRALVVPRGHDGAAKESNLPSSASPRPCRL